MSHQICNTYSALIHWKLNSFIKLPLNLLILVANLNNLELLLGLKFSFSDYFEMKKYMIHNCESIKVLLVNKTTHTTNSKIF